MIVLFILINICVYVYGKWLYSTRNNPICIYSFTWGVSALLYELKLIYYHDITVITWLVILFFEIVFVVSCQVGSNTKIILRTGMINNGSTFNTTKYDEELLRVIIRKWIWIFSSIAAIAILSGLVSLLRDYGSIVTAIQLSNKIYNDRIDEGVRYINIPYLSCFSFAALIFSGIYWKKYGFRLFLVIPILLVCVMTIMTGTRYYLVFSLILILTPLFLNRDKNKKNGKVWRKVLVVIAIGVLVCVFVTITSVRSSWILIDSSVSPLLAKLMHNFGNGVYKVYSYFASPIGVLNAYLKDPYFAPGQSSFAFAFNILERLGLITFEGIAKNYYIPIAANTGTYVKDFIADFHVFAVFVAFIWGFICGKTYSKARNNYTIKTVSVYSVVSTLLWMGFFTWYLCETVIWISLVVVIIVGISIDRRCRIDEA